MGSNDIDARMAALLKDHQAMGARPKDEEPADAHAPTYPLRPSKAPAPKTTTKRKGK